jgi:hypothetical protein
MYGPDIALSHLLSVAASADMRSDFFWHKKGAGRWRIEEKSGAAETVVHAHGEHTHVQFGLTPYSTPTPTVPSHRVEIAEATPTPPRAEFMKEVLV